MRLGVFDSGLGGLTVLREVRARYPRADLTYLADQAHVPYGDRDPAEILRLLRGNLATLERCGVDAIVMGCNTTCAIASAAGWPAANVPIFDLIAAGAQAVRDAGVARVAVVATVATVRSAAYARAIARVAPATLVQSVAAPALVPLVERGAAESAEAAVAVAAACAEIDGAVDAIVYGCTHFPLLDRAFAAVAGTGTLRIDPACAQAYAVAAHFGAREERNGGRTTYLTTGDPVAFRRGLVAATGPLAALDTVGAAPALARAS